MCKLPGTRHGLACAGALLCCALRSDKSTAQAWSSKCVSYNPAVCESVQRVFSVFFQGTDKNAGQDVASERFLWSFMGYHPLKPSFLSKRALIRDTEPVIDWTILFSGLYFSISCTWMLWELLSLALLKSESVSGEWCRCRLNRRLSVSRIPFWKANTPGDGMGLTCAFIHTNMVVI